MVRSLQNLQSELNELTQKTSLLATELYRQYENYCEILGKSAQKQLILAVYQVCTQIYPEAFLKLPFSQREALQENLRQISQILITQLRSTLAHPQDLPPQNAIEPFEEANAPPLAHLSAPDAVLLWGKQREQAITEVLDKVSEEVNQLLQRFQVIPRQIPSKLLEIALKNGDNDSSSGKAANILDLLLEASEDEDEEDDRFAQEERSLTKITAIHLRRSEIEFNDAHLIQSAKKTYQILHKLSQLRQHYHRNQRENAIATAEAAWRSSWREEE
jgi:hypothetical protein